MFAITEGEIDSLFCNLILNLTKLGGSKIFKCPECGHKIGRDLNGALGILLKVLSDKTFTISFDGDAIAVQYGNIPHCSA